MTNSVSFEDVSEAGNSNQNDILDSKPSSQSNLHKEVDYSKAKKLPIFFAALSGKATPLV